MFKISTLIWWQGKLDPFGQPEPGIDFVTVTSPSPLEFQSLSEPVSLSGNLITKMEFNDQHHQAKHLELSSGVKLLSYQLEFRICTGVWRSQDTWTGITAAEMMGWQPQEEEEEELTERKIMCSGMAMFRFRA